jgi:glycosyltransferase involved in cell wall biosynthesis
LLHRETYLKILYIQRRVADKEVPRPKWLREFRGVELKGQDGFFEASLCTAFPDVCFSYLHEVAHKPSSFFEKFDWVLVNRKSVSDENFNPEILSGLLNRTGQVKVGLVVNNAKEFTLPVVEQLAPFDLVFKREHFKECDAYGYPDEIIQKLRVTMISCPFLRVYRKRKKLRVSQTALQDQGRRIQDVDVSFVGADTSKLRRSFLMDIGNSPLNFQGGLYNHKQKDQPVSWAGPRMAQQGLEKYLELIRRTKVNLALPGYGGFTYRHLELWYLGAFVLSSPQIRKIKLPSENQPVEGVHYVAFDSMDDMVEKVNYYVKEEGEREQIAAQGRAYFRELYDFKAHGCMIANALCVG